MLNLEITHIGYTAMAFGFMVPGMLLIVAGQNILTGKEFSVDYMVYKPESRNNSKIEQKQKIV